MKRNFKYILLIVILIFILILCIFNNNKTKEGFLDTKHKKTIYLVWRNKIQKSGTNHGFGDKLRGAIFLYQYCKKNKINFKIDATDDICSDFLKNVKSPDYDKIKNQQIINFGDKPEKEVKKTIQKMFNENTIKYKNPFFNKNRDKQNDNTIYIYTNTWPNDLNADDKEFAKFICEPNDDIKDEVNEKIKNLPQNFGIQHFRFKDDVFKNDVPENNKLFEKYFTLLLENNKNTDVLFTNSNNFKKYAKEELNITTVECDNGLCKIEHIGNSDNKESVKNSFIEFIILSKAKYIKSHTCYSWPSNFVHWPAKIYDIPFDNVYIDEKTLT